VVDYCDSRDMFQVKCDKCKRLIDRRREGGQIEIRGVADRSGIDLCGDVQHRSSERFDGILA
jgi:hypothetical protein